MEFCLAGLGFLVVLYLINLPFSLVEKSNRKRKIEKAFAGRQELTEREFYENYFKEKGVPFHVVAFVRKALAEELKADLSRLRPDDKYYDLSFKWVDDYIEYTDLANKFSDKFRITISEKEMEQVISFNDLVDLVWQKIKDNQR